MIPSGRYISTCGLITGIHWLLKGFIWYHVTRFFGKIVDCFYYFTKICLTVDLRFCIPAFQLICRDIPNRWNCIFLIISGSDYQNNLKWNKLNWILIPPEFIVFVLPDNKTIPSEMETHLQNRDWTEY